MRIIKTCSYVIVVITALCAFLAAQDMKPQEIISRHLASIGTKETRDEIKTLMAVGNSTFEAKNPVVNGGGRGIVVSDPDNLFFVLSFNSKNYPFEKIGYFDGKVNIPFVDGGKRSLLGAFITEHSKVLTDGMFGGAMSLRWPFLEMDKRKPKVQSAGIKKIDNRKVYVLDYLPTGSGSSEFTVRLYFDGETFNHVRSEFRREIRPGNPAFGVQNQIANSTLVLTEDFSDFKTVDGLTLPYTYRVDFLSNSNASVYESIWGLKVGQYYVNQKLAPDFFMFDAK